ncbi:MAG: hypothetical protein AAFX87_21895 [Bacteroidota bacterium]
MMRKSYLWLLVILALWSCGDDEEPGGGTPDSVTLSDLIGDWLDLSITNGTTTDGFVVVDFSGDPAFGILEAFGVNNQDFGCNENVFRNIMVGPANTFIGEGLVDQGSGSEWVPIVITLDNANQISVTYEGCTACDFVPDVMVRVDDTNVPVPVLIDSDIDDDITLIDLVCDPTQPDYIVEGFLDVDAVLTIESGVVIEFGANAGFIMREFGGGALIANGATANSIVFTGQTKTPGFWRGLVFQTNDVRNELNNVVVEYAGSDQIADDILGGVRAGIAVDVEPGGAAASLRLTNSTIRENDGYGLVMEWFSQLREFSNNTFEDNTEAAVLLEAINVGALDAGSQYAGGNGFEGVEIAGTSAGNALRDDATWPGLEDGAIYRVLGNIEIEATLTISPGATLEFEANSEIFFGVPFDRPEGIIRAIGTADNPITFTGVQKTPGYWKGIVIQSTSNQNLMEFCIVEYGGSDAIFGGQPANISLDIFNFAPSLTIFDSIIRNSAGCGIYVQSINSDLIESDNTFTSNPSGDVCFD